MLIVVFIIAAISAIASNVTSKRREIPGGILSVLSAARSAPRKGANWHECANCGSRPQFIYTIEERFRWQEGCG
jgi:hypothetical protein